MKATVPRYRGRNQPVPPQFPMSGSIGEDDDGILRYATYDYGGNVTWKPVPRWMWLLRRRVYKDLANGDYKYVYWLDRHTS